MRPLSSRTWRDLVGGGRKVRGGISPLQGRANEKHAISFAKGGMQFCSPPAAWTRVFTYTSNLFLNWMGSICLVGLIESLYIEVVLINFSRT